MTKTPLRGFRKYLKWGSHRGRDRNHRSALQLYARTGNLSLVERRNLFDQIRQLESDLLKRESKIRGCDQYIHRLRQRILRYANQWNRHQMQHCCSDLQEHNRRMPQELKEFTQKYEDLKAEHIENSNRLKELEGSYKEIENQKYLDF